MEHYPGLIFLQYGEATRCNYQYKEYQNKEKS